ncbi:MAG: winged helix-turn-helix domain-containing protein [Pseudomonadota bacterium]
MEPSLGQLEGHDTAVTLEPRVMELLVLLVEHAGQVVSRAQIEEALWGDVVVGEDTVARTVSKLRRALGDSAKAPEYIDTLPKRGYRIIAPVEALADAPAPSARRPRVLAATAVALLLAAAMWAWWRVGTPTLAPSPAHSLTERADDRYMRFTRADNEAAIVLYERALGVDGEYGPAHAGLANALVQRVIRWPSDSRDTDMQAATLTEALARELHQTPLAQETLRRASAMAQRAARLAPRNSDALKALGLTYAAQGDLGRAADTYRRAIALDPQAWESMINLGEIHQINGESVEAARVFAEAFDAMDRAYAAEPQRVGPWQGALGVVVASLQVSLGNTEEAELWYRRVLERYPLNVEATRGLARLLEAGGDPSQAQQLCRQLVERLGPLVKECPGPRT